MKKLAERFMTGIFCDDIRHEMGNKLSFMGCYQSELLVPAFPAVLPKFCVFVSALTPNQRPFKSLTLRVFLNDDLELASVDVPAEGLTESALIQDETSTRKIVSTAIAFAPLVIEKPSALRLKAVTEEGEIVGPRLLIKAMTAQEVSAPVQPNKAKPVKRRVGVKKPAAKKTASKA